MADFYLYCDESGKLGNSPYTAFCGYVSHITEWQRFSLEWANCRHAWQVPPIHMAEIMFPDRKAKSEWAEVKTRWGKDWEAKREAMLTEFSTLIARSHIVCVGNVVDAAHFDTMPDSKFKRDMKNPLYLSFYHTVRNALDTLENHGVGGQTLSIVVDDDQDYSLQCYALLNAMRNAFPEEVGKRVDAMCFARDIAYPGVQAADMIAYESRSLMIQRVNSGKQEPSDLFGRLTKVWRASAHTIYGTVLRPVCTVR